jgi:hypothetical protein
MESASAGAKMDVSLGPLFPIALQTMMPKFAACFAAREQIAVFPFMSR